MKELLELEETMLDLELLESKIEKLNAKLEIQNELIKIKEGAISAGCTRIEQIMKSTDTVMARISQRLVEARPEMESNLGKARSDQIITTFFEHHAEIMKAYGSPVL